MNDVLRRLIQAAYDYHLGCPWPSDMLDLVDEAIVALKKAETDIGDRDRVIKILSDTCERWSAQVLSMKPRKGNE